MPPLHSPPSTAYLRGHGLLLAASSLAGTPPLAYVFYILLLLSLHATIAGIYIDESVDSATLALTRA